MDQDLEMLSASFRLAATRHFISSGLCSMLAARIAEDSDILEVVRVSNAGGFPPYLLLGAVHSLVLGSPNCELARFFPTVSRQPIPDADPYPAFKEFVLGARDQITAILRSAHVNKTVVNRSACLRALLVQVAQRNGWDRVHLVDIGCGAGLNLLLDQWRIRYGEAGAAGPVDSLVQFSIEVREGSLPPLGELPVILTRTGIDLDSFDLADAVQERWLLGCLFPDHPDTFDLTKQAIAALRRNPPRFVTGNAGVELLNVLGEIPGNDPVVVMHSLALHQIRPEQIRSMHQAIRQTRSIRPMARIGMEILGDKGQLTLVDSDDMEPLSVGDTDYDASWMRWF